MCEAIGCLQDCRVFGGALVAVYSLPLLQWGTVDLESLTVPATSDWPGKKKLCVRPPPMVVRIQNSKFDPAPKF